MTRINKEKAFLGAIVADAATMPCHWIYSKEEIRQACEDIRRPEFNPLVLCPLYDSKQFPGHYHTGQLSPNGDNLLALMKILSSLTDEEDDIDILALKYAEWISNYGGRKDHTNFAFETGITEGLTYPSSAVANDRNAGHTFNKVIVSIVNNFFDKTDLLISFHQNSSIARDCGCFMASILQFIEGGKSPRQAYSLAKRLAPLNLTTHLDFLDKSFLKETSLFLEEWKNEFSIKGNNHINYENPGALLRSIHILVTATSYVDGVRKNILVGGDNCATAGIIGAGLAMHHRIPLCWMTRINRSLAMDLKENYGIQNNILDHAVNLMAGLKHVTKDRRWRLKMYKNCFTHEDAVRWMMDQYKGPSSSELEAIAVEDLNILLDAGYISHVCDKKRRFSADETLTLFFKFDGMVYVAERRDQDMMFRR